MSVFTADFETTTKEDDCRVWLWGFYDIYSGEFAHGKTIDEFMHVMFIQDSCKVYFHNLKFDGEFILYYLFRNGFEVTKERKLKNKQFKTLINDSGQFYSITIKYKSKTFTILDSLKIIPLPVRDISKAFNLKKSKGECDFSFHREIGYQPTIDEIEYVKGDCSIVGDALKFFLDQALDKMTQASNALKHYKETVGNRFDKWFPADIPDEVLRQSYKGGFTYADKRIRGKEIKEGLVFDVNSLYPAMMYYKKLPYGYPKFFKGQYQDDEVYDVFIQMFTCVFELKKDHIPCIQIKQSKWFSDTEYLESSEGLEVTLCLTNVDFNLMMDHYDVSCLEFHGGYKFKSSDMLFRDYIDYWIKIKNESTVNGNAGMRTIAKLMLNSLYGKFAINPSVGSKIPEYDSGADFIHYNVEIDERESIYVPVAAFITAYARETTIRAAQKNYHRFLYADTDSLHLSGYEIPDNIEVDNVALGAWKLEYLFKRGKFLRAKSYVEEVEGSEGVFLHVACAGLPHMLHDKVTFENFNDGLEINGKLQQKRVSGGVILKEIDFKIKGPV